MARYCIKCGAVNSDSATICNRCKKQLNNMTQSSQKIVYNSGNSMNVYAHTNSVSTHGNGNYDYTGNVLINDQNPNKSQLKNYRHGHQSEKKLFGSKKQIYFVMGVVAVIFACALIGAFTILNKPSSSWLKDNLPREMLKYRLVTPEDSGIDSGEIRSLEIVEQYEEMGYPAYKGRTFEKSQTGKWIRGNKRIAVARNCRVIEIENPRNHIYSLKNYIRKYKVKRGQNIRGIETYLKIKGGKITEIDFSA